MSYFLITFLISAIAIALTHYKKSNFVVVLPVIVLFMIIFLYLLALTGWLFISQIVFIIIGFLSLVYLVVMLYKKEATLKSLFLSPGLIIFLFFIFMNYFWNANRLLAHWDEFSHWGLVVKNMFIFNAFGNASEATTYFTEYPPGSSLLLYFYTSFNNTFSEPFLYMSFNVMQTALLLPVLKIYDLSNWRYAVLPAMIILSLPLVFYENAYSSLYVDGLIGLAFAYLVYTHYSEKYLTNFKLISLSLGATFLVLIKPIGIFFALLAMGIILLDSFFGTCKVTIKAKLLMFIPLIALLLTDISWNLHLSNSTSEHAWNTSGLSLLSVFALLSNPPEFALATIKSFARQVAPYLHLGLLFIGLSGLVYYFFPQCSMIKARRLVILSSLLGAGFGFYALILLVLYLTIFTEQGAVNLVSFSRYMNSYALGSVLVIVFLMLMIINDVKEYKKLLLGYLLIHLSLFAGPAIYSGYQEIKYSQVLRAGYEKTLLFEDLMDAQEDRIYYISQGSKGLDYWITRYNVTPLHLNRPFSWNISNCSYQKGDPYMKNISAAEWRDILTQNYTYVYLYSVDDYFKQDYGELFSDDINIRNRTLYKVNIEKDSLVLVEAD